MRFLARAFVATGRARYRDAFTRALDHVLAAQYPNGGWPQSDPPGKGYARYITFNDNTMVNLLELARDVARSDDFRFVDRARREAADRAFAAGVACILKCQVRVDGRLTAWCAQHDETTLEPRGARIVRAAVAQRHGERGHPDAADEPGGPGPGRRPGGPRGARWYEDAKLTGIRQVVVDGDKKIVPDRAAPPLWARFYEIGTNRPFFCGRDGVKKDDLAEIEAERRNGYAWYGEWGRRVLTRYARWEKETSLRWTGEAPTGRLVAVRDSESPPSSRAYPGGPPPCYATG